MPLILLETIFVNTVPGSILVNVLYQNLSQFFPSHLCIFFASVSCNKNKERLLP
jgi:hypothetical protein